MPEHFTILSRKDRAPCFGRVMIRLLDWKRRISDEPLCGFSNYTEDIPIGTVVGVQIQSNEMSQAKYKASLTHGMEIFKEGIKITSAENDENENLFLSLRKSLNTKKYSNIFFKITGFDPDNLTYWLSQFSFTKIKLSVKVFENIAMRMFRWRLTFIQINHLSLKITSSIWKVLANRPECSNHFAFLNTVDELKKLIDSDGTVGRNELKKKLIEKGLPFKGNYRNVIFSKSKNKNPGVWSYFILLLDEHRSFLSQFWVRME